MIILDTNVISAIMRPVENAVVINWLDTQKTDRLWTTAITVMEVRYGIERMAIGRRQTAVSSAFDGVLDLIGWRILDFTSAAAERAAKLTAKSHGRGHNIDVPDSQIAGIAAFQTATLATRNVKDFADLDIPLVDPWTA